MMGMRLDDQLVLRQRLEQGMDEVTAIFKAYYEDDYKNLSDHLLGVFLQANAYARPSLVRSSWEYAARSKDASLQRMLGRSLEAVIKGHVGQYRDSGVHYASHPVQVAYVLAELGCSEDVVITGNLHDVLEENEQSYASVLEDVERSFGADVAFKLLALSVFEQGEDRDRQQMKRLWYAADVSGNHDVLYVKVADVITNLYTKRFMMAKKGFSSEERQRRFVENARSSILPVARLIDDEGPFNLHLSSYVRELIRR